MTTETMRSLDEIMSREPATDEPVQTNQEPAQPETAGQGQSRDEQGKFAPKQQEPAAEANGDPDNAAQAAVEGGKPEKGTVPLPALQAAREKERAERERADRLERELAEIRGQVSVLTQQRQPQPEQPKPTPPAVWEDPDGWLAHKLSEVQSRGQNERLQTSELLAVEKYGEATVTEAGEALLQLAKSGDPGAAADYNRIMSSRHPYGELVSWHQRRKAMAEIGEDPAAYRERLRQEILAELTPSAPAAPAPQPAAPPVMPTNFASSRSEGPRSAVTYSGPKPLSEIVKGPAQ